MAELEVAAVGEMEIRMQRLFDAPRENVFRAFTEPDLIKQWLYGPEGHSLPICEIDLQVGGSLRYVWRLEDGKEMGLSGRFLEIVPPERIVHTELFDEDWTGGETVVTTEFLEQGAQTLVTMTVRYSSPKVRETVLNMGMADGVAQSYDRLDGLLQLDYKNLVRRTGRLERLK